MSPSDLVVVVGLVFVTLLIFLIGYSIGRMTLIPPPEEDVE